MSDHRVTIRLTEAEHHAIKTKALTAGASVAETIRALIQHGGEGGAQVGAIAEVMTALLDRLEQLETRESEPPAPPDLMPIQRQLVPIEQRIERVERALNSLVSAVERLYQTPVAAAKAPAAQSVNPAHTPVPDMPIKPVPGRPPFDRDFMLTIPIIAGENTTERMARCRAEYQRQFGPL